MASRDEKQVLALLRESVLSLGDRFVERRAWQDKHYAKIIAKLHRWLREAFDTTGSKVSRVRWVIRRHDGTTDRLPGVKIVTKRGRIFKVRPLRTLTGAKGLVKVIVGSREFNIQLHKQGQSWRIVRHRRIGISGSISRIALTKQNVCEEIIHALYTKRNG